VLGLVFVGISGFLNTNLHTDGNNSNMSNNGLFIIGVITVVSGQFASSFQMVLEEKFLKDANISPLYMIGWEGIFGLIVTCAIGFPIISNIPGNDCNKYIIFFCYLLLIIHSLLFVKDMKTFLMVLL
jgi:hypothetical protein